MIKETIIYLIGDMPRPNLAGNLILGFIGMLLPMAWKVMNRDPHDPRTPVKFSFRFFIVDSVKSMASRFIFLVVIIVFVAPYCKIELNPILALFIGVLLPEIVSKIMGSLPQIASILLPSFFTKEKENIMPHEDFAWFIDFEKDSDVILNKDKTTSSIPDFAESTLGTVTGLSIEYDLEPTFTVVEFQRTDLTQYSAAPIKRPKKPL